MNKGILAAAIMGLGGVVGMLALDPFAATPKAAVPIDTVRAVRLAADTEITEELQATCNAGIVELGDKTLCLTDQADVPGEIVTVPPGQKRDMLLCDVETEEDSGVWTTEVRYLPTGTLPPKCQLVCEDLLFPGLSMANVETGIEACLRLACAPCPISGSSWNACPHCLSDLTPSCAESCPVPNEEVN